MELKQIICLIYEYRYKMTKPVSVIKTAQSTGLKGKRLAQATKPATAPEATPVVQPTSGAETGASAKEQAQESVKILK